MCLVMRKLFLITVLAALGHSSIVSAQSTPLQPLPYRAPQSAPPTGPETAPDREANEDSAERSERDAPMGAPPVIPDEDTPPVPDVAPLVTITPEQDSDSNLAIAPPISDMTPAPAKPKAPDYSELSEAEERAARLDDLFKRIKSETDAETASLIAEEIWAIWLDSGSDSVNMLLRRGTAAEKRSDDRLARRMYDHVTTLSPDFAEGWSRSARLAIEEEDLSRALSDVTTALVIEPRHFYALWTLGNIFERIGKQDAALEAYRQANDLYPELKAVKDRLELLGGTDDGDVL